MLRKCKPPIHLKSHRANFFVRKLTPSQTVDISHEAQISAIERSFNRTNDEFDLSKLGCPGKPHLKAVDSLEILPDIDIWANAYDLFKFSERPGDRPIDVCAKLRVYLQLYSGSH